MLKVTKTRQLVTEFFAQDGDQQKLVKTTVINEMRYKIEDAILAELEADSEHKE
ncbi:prophage protein [Streptococcus pneumoniae]|nr:prophage protein [Streptococcus pneumoniae]